MHFIKKNWSNILFALVIVLLIIPQTGMPIKVFVTRLIAFSPSEVDEKDIVVLNDYRWNLTKLEGSQVNFVQSKGKVTLINLWATWCPPCVAEMPSLQKLYNRYGDRVDFYFVSSEESPRLQKFLQKKEYDLPVYIERHAPPALLQTTSIPTTYVISKSGQIVVNETGAADWNSEKVYEILDALVQE